MSAFYDLASLVLVPSGYKAQKVYAQKPLTTDGQLTFSRASTATRVNSAGLIETVSSNVPRLDYLGSTCPKLLLEPQRVNVCLQSSTFTSTTWNKQNCVVTANAATSPDGTVDADLTYPTINTSIAAPNQFFTVSAGVSYTTSIYVKAAGKNFVALYDLSGGNGTSMWVNLTTGAITNGNLGSNRFAVNVGNGWWRIGFTQSIGGTTGYVHIYPTDAAGSNAVTVNGTDGILIWGAQVEAGAYPTSLIQTTTAAVTRLVDAMSKSSYACGITTEATLFADFEYQNTGSGYSTHFLIYNVSAGHYIYLTVLSNSIRALCVSGGVLQSSIILSSTTAGTRYKVAAKFKQNDFALYVNGTLVGTDTSGTMPTFGTSGVTSYIGNDASATEPAGYVRQYIVFPTALTNAQLTELTAL